MYINAKFNSLALIDGGVSVVKSGEIPKEPIVSEKGTFIVTERPKLMLYLICEDGRLIGEDIYPAIRAYTSVDITKAFRNQLAKVMKEFNFVIHNGKILNLHDILLKIIE